MANHALLSASASHRWLECPPSVKLSERYPDNQSEYAAEGTDAHELCAYKVLKALGKETEDPTPSLKHYSSEMEECANGYAAFVMERFNAAKLFCYDPLILIEQRLDYSRFIGIEESFGTGDCVIIDDTLLQIIDYKHGLGILVNAEDNSQLKLYALGALEMFDALYNIETICLSIYQPRRENVSTWEIGKAELLKWAEETLAQTAKLAAAGKGEFKAGNHCQFCKAKAECRKRAEYNLEMAKYDFAPPDTLTDEEVSIILAKADELVAWASDVKEHALKKAVAGTKFDGYKLVEGRSVRKYADEDAAAQAVIAAGYEPYEKKILGITEMSKLLGKAKFAEILGSLVKKPKGKPTLVPESDKRKAINPANDAAEDFNDNN